MAEGMEAPHELQKSATGIRGFDEISNGGLPVGRPTLIVGGAGSGKTLFAMEFIVRGATQFNEPGVFISFEETAADLGKNFASRAVDLDALIAQKKIFIDYVYIERSEIEETGEYDLEGLFIRLEHAIDSIGAKRVVLDTIEVLFGGLSDQGILRAELRRLFRWLKTKGVTAIVTGERGDTTLTRYGLEEYIADCVIMLDNRVNDQISTRRIRILKYRGSKHGSNEYPFLIGNTGIIVLPITSVALEHQASCERVSTGIPSLDDMFGGKGFFRGSSVLVSGPAGTGKSSVGAAFLDAACRRGERCLYWAFEESPSQIQRNMRSIGIDLKQWVDKGLLTFHAVRPTLAGLETHLAEMAAAIDDVKPSNVFVDPISNLLSVGNLNEVKAMLIRLIDMMKMRQITSLHTNLSQANGIDETEVGVSSLMDAWISLRNIETDGERTRAVYLLKSRGMNHSNQVREFVISDKGVDLVDVYLGPDGVLTGSARLAQQAREQLEEVSRQQDLETRQRGLQRKKDILEAQIKALHAEYGSAEEELRTFSREEELRQSTLLKGRAALLKLRGSATKNPGNTPLSGEKEDPDGI